MKRQLLSRRLVFLLSAFIGVGSAVGVASAATVPPIKHPKKQIRVIRTECLVVATEAKRILPAFPASEPFGRELYARISENVNSITVLGVTFRILDLLEVPDGRDVLGGQVQAPSGPGWKPQYLDTAAAATQRHHYGFYFFTAANDGGRDFILGLFGNLVNDVKDIFTSNQGDLNLADEAVRQGALARAAGVSTVSGQVKGMLCTP